MALKMVNEKEEILFYLDGEKIYYIDKFSDLDEVIEIEGAKCSSWVLQLLDKIWLNDTSMLYELAKIIQENEPNNEIDWELTFFIVEKKTLLESVASEEDAYNFFEKVEIGVRESTPENHRKIKEIVRRKLESMGLKS